MSSRGATSGGTNAWRAGLLGAFVGAGLTGAVGALLLRRYGNSSRPTGGPTYEPLPLEQDDDNRCAENESLLQEQLARCITFFGEDGMQKLRGSFVVVVGVGGVGSHAAHMLVRSGIERIRIVDFDQVTLSSLNRHAVATRADVGVSKVRALKNHLLQICPHADIDARNTLFSAESAENLLAGDPDFVLDCIDNIDTKADLLAICHRKGLRVLASMGAGGKADPSRVRIGDLSETLEDPLSRAVRAQLRRRGVTDGVMCVFSTERGSVGLLPKGDHIDKAEDYQLLKGFRVRIMPVLGPMPAIFGQAMASFVLSELGQRHFEPYACQVPSIKVYTKMMERLRRHEKDVYGASGDAFRLNDTDVRFIVEEIWRGRSPISGITQRLQLVRWDPAQPADVFNTIALTKDEAQEHSKRSSLNDVDPKIRACVEERLKLASTW